MQTVITKFDLCGSLIAAVVLFTTLRLVTRRDSRSTDAAWWIAGFLFVVVVVSGAIAVWPPQSLQFLIVIEIGMIAGSLGGIIGALITPPILIAFESHRKRIEDWNAEVDQENRLIIREREREQAHRHAMEEREAQQKHELERQRIAALTPPPTREEKEAAIRKKYEGRLGLLDAAKLGDDERRAAQERAKQQYLRELDELLK